MSCVPPRRIVISTDRDAWRAARDARRKVLAKVRAPSAGDGATENDTG